MLTLYWSGPYYRIWLFTELYEVSIGHLQRARHANRGYLLLRTPSIVLSHFGTCLCSNVETNLSWSCLVSGLVSNNRRYFSFALFSLVLSFSDKYPNSIKVSKSGNISTDIDTSFIKKKTWKNVRTIHASWYRSIIGNCLQCRAHQQILIFKYLNDTNQSSHLKHTFLSAISSNCQNNSLLPLVLSPTHHPLNRGMHCFICGRDGWLGIRRLSCSCLCWKSKNDILHGWIANAHKLDWIRVTLFNKI